MKFLLSKKLRFFILLLAIIILVIWLFSLELEGETRRFVLRYGYLGFFLISAIGGVNIIFPLPNLIFIPPLLEVGLSPLILSLIAAFGTTVSDGIGYVLGRAGGEAFEKNLRGFQGWAGNTYKKHPRLMPLVLLFWSATIPMPNEILVIPAGISGYGLVKTLLLTTTGNLIFFTTIIHLGNLFLRT